MNIERDTTIRVAVNYADLVKALKLLHPREFMLEQLPVDAKAVEFELLPKGVQITYTRKAQGPAEIPFNRMQRMEEADPA